MYTPGHRCPAMQRAINRILMIEPQHQVPVIQVVVPNLPLPAPAPAPKKASTIMHISAAAYHGDTTEASISLLIHLTGVPLVALADTGSTNTFLDQQFAMD